jgi:hypothetical protein
MSLNYPKLAIPDVEETIAFRCIDSILRTDPTIKRIVKDFGSWTGEASDIFGPTPATCPNLMLTPRANGSKWETEGQHAMPFSIIVMVAVNGTNIDQLLNFWGCIRRALWPSDMERMEAIHAKMAEAKIIRPTITMNAFAPFRTKDGGRVWIAEGSINLLLHINTP